MLFALGFWGWSLPGLLVIVVVAVVIRLMLAEVERQGENELRQRRREREISERMWRQHQLVMRGDRRGTYGVATPAVFDYERTVRR